MDCQSVRSPDASVTVIIQCMTRRWSVLWMFAFLTFFGVLEAIYRVTNDLVYRHRTSVAIHLIGEVTATWTSGALFLLLLPFVKRHRFTRQTWKRQIGWHLLALIGYSLAHTFLMWLARIPLFPIFGFGHYDYGVIPIRIVMEFSADIVGYSGFVAVAHAIWMYRDAREKEVALAQAQLVNLQQQLQPHFLFNALNAISNLVYENPRQADEMIGRLSELLRRTLHMEAMVPFSEELKSAEMYLDMMQVRMEDRLSVEIDVEKDVGGIPVPHFLLQPLIENALKHGVDPATNTVDLSLTVSRRDERLLVEVSDHGPGSESGAQGIGLSNTRARLEKIYGSGHRFHTESNNGFHCFIELPCAP